MSVDHEKNDALTRQRLYRERQRVAGFKQNTVWLHIESEKEGVLAAREGKPLLPMLSIHPVSWAYGWVNEKLRGL